MEIIYQTTFKKINDSARESLLEKMLITFQENVPEDLADYCFIHNHGILHKPMQVGDILELDDIEYTITAIGSLSNQNLETLGHVTWIFDGAAQAMYPGSVHLQGNVPNHINVNSILKIKHS